ncbi:hypothetical protein NDN23_27065, partial [Escherichia coli]|uniref:hypothetical protein n=1 Tax=Enterobacteriaceae TaxID=543 RepID=UPI001C4DE0A5
TLHLLCSEYNKSTLVYDKKGIFMAGIVIYRAKCLNCRHEWTSRAGFGTPDYCPKCRSKLISCSAIR